MRGILCFALPFTFHLHRRYLHLIIFLKDDNTFSMCFCTLYVFFSIAVLFEDAVILGAASDGVTYKPPCEDTKKSVQNLPFCIVERTVSTHLSKIASTSVEISFH